jgi:hypothetical protein
MTKKATERNDVVNIQPLHTSTVHCRIIGTEPLYQNRMSAKAKQGFLVGTKKKTKAERTVIKHDPVQEYRDAIEPFGLRSVPGSVNLHDAPTAVGLRTVSVKSSMCQAAIETAGMTKAGSQRLLYIAGEKISLYGTPKLRLDIVRSADMARTPDLRSRPIFGKWGAEVSIRFVCPQLSAQGVITLLQNAGMLIGLGDNRQEKGKGAYGSFRVLGTNENDDEWNDLVQSHGREAQLAAIEAPEYWDDETAELMDFYFGEVQRRAA